MAVDRKLTDMSGQAQADTAKVYIVHTSGDEGWVLLGGIKDHSHDLNAITDTSTYVRMSSGERAKLLGIVAGAEPNGAELPVGTILPYAGSVAPTNYAKCDGTELLRSNYPSLFGAVGTNYNLPGTNYTKFRLPDLRGRAPIGYGTGTGGTTSKVLGATGGAETHSLIINEMPSHRHGLNVGSSFGGGTAAMNVPNIGTSSSHIGDTGGNAAHNNMQPYLAINYIIKLT